MTVVEVLQRYMDAEEYQATLLLLGFVKREPKDGNPYDMTYRWMVPGTDYRTEYDGREIYEGIQVSGNSAGTMVTVSNRSGGPFIRQRATPFSGYGQFDHVLAYVKQEMAKFEQRRPDTGGA